MNGGGALLLLCGCTFRSSAAPFLPCADAVKFRATLKTSSPAGRGFPGPGRRPGRFHFHAPPPSRRAHPRLRKLLVGSQKPLSLKHHTQIHPHTLILSQKLRSHTPILTNASLVLIVLLHLTYSHTHSHTHQPTYTLTHPSSTRMDIH